MVAREGFGRHYMISLPIAGIHLNPKLAKSSNYSEM